jgi:AcrR family transcriptional regulator
MTAIHGISRSSTEDTTPPRPGEHRTTKRSPGRPRVNQASWSGRSTRDEILEVAARLFTEHGFADTTTRQIADTVGIKQASLYYHFADKSSIFGALIAGTTEMAVHFADWLEDQDVDPTTRLYALARFTLDAVLAERWYLRDLYRQSPDGTSIDGLCPYGALRERYLRFATDASAMGTDPEAVAGDLDVVFGLVESVLAQRDWGDASAPRAYAHSVARSCLRLVRAPEPLVSTVESIALDIIERYTVELEG